MIFLCIFVLFSCFSHFTGLYNLHKTAILLFYTFLLYFPCYNKDKRKIVSRSEFLCAAPANKMVMRRGEAV